MKKKRAICKAKTMSFHCISHEVERAHGIKVGSDGAHVLINQQQLGWISSDL